MKSLINKNFFGTKQGPTMVKESINFECKEVQSSNNNQKLRDNEATFTQNKDKTVNLDGSNLGSLVNKSNNNKTNKVRPEENKSLVNEKPVKPRRKARNETNDANSSCEEKSIVKAKEEPLMAKKSIEKHKIEANDCQTDIRNNKSVYNHKQIVQSENSGKVENNSFQIDFDHYSDNLTILSQHISINVQQFKNIRSLLNDYKGNKAKRLKSFNNIKAKCQSFGQTYDEIKKCLSFSELRFLVNHIFFLRTNLWKEIHSNGGNSLAVNNDFKVTENTKKLVDGIIEYLEQFYLVVSFASQSLSSLYKVLNGDEVDKTNEQQGLRSVFNEYKEHLKILLEKLKNIEAFIKVIDVRSDVIDIIILTRAFFAMYESIFVGYV